MSQTARLTLAGIWLDRAADDGDDAGIVQPWQGDLERITAGGVYEWPIRPRATRGMA